MTQSPRDNAQVEAGAFRYRYLVGPQLDALLATGDGVVHSITVGGGTGGQVYLFDESEGGLIYNQINFPNSPGLSSFPIDFNYRTRLHAIIGGAMKVTIAYSTISPDGSTLVSDNGIHVGVIEDVGIQFTQDVTGFTVGDITVVNGTLSSFTTRSANFYTVLVTPTAGTNVQVSVSVAAGVCTIINAGISTGQPNIASNTITFTATS